MSHCSSFLSSDALLQKIRLKISRVYYNHGLFISTHPAPVITIVCILMIFVCYPLTQIPFVKEVPVHRAVVRDDEFQSFKDSRYVFTHDYQNKSLGYMLQIVVHSKILTKIPNCHVDYETVAHLLQQSDEMVELVRQFRSSGDESTPGGQTFDDICFQVEDRVVNDVENSDTIKNALPTFGCLILAPSFLLGDHLGIVQSHQASVLSRIKLAATGNLLDILFGLPWKMTGLSKMSKCSSEQIVTYALTLVFREYKPSFFLELRDYLIYSMENLHKDVNITMETRKSNETINAASVGHIFLVWYSDRSYFADYAPLLFIYVILLLYVYFSVRKLEMVKSKWGLALSACVTVAASLFMSIGLCVTIGLVMPTLNGSEVFPYLVVLIGFENVIVLTKSVVATPIDLPVKYRIAEGLSKESWSHTKLYLAGLLLLGLGFLTFHPTMQEFCLFAVVGLTTDFFLQLFFFVTILSVDIRRMELSDLMLEYPVHSFMQEPQMIPPFYSFTSPLSSSTSFSSLDKIMTESPSCKIPKKPDSSLAEMTGEKGNRISNKYLAYTLSFISNISFMLFRSVKPIFRLAKLCILTRHRRKVSAAQTAAYLASDGQISQNVPRRLRVLRCWAKSRLIQRVLLFVFSVWVIIILIHAVDIVQLLFNICAYVRILPSQYFALHNWLTSSYTSDGNHNTINTTISSSIHNMSLDNQLLIMNSTVSSLYSMNSSIHSSDSQVNLFNAKNDISIADHRNNSTREHLNLTLNNNLPETDHHSNHNFQYDHDISTQFDVVIDDENIKSQMNVINILHHLQLNEAVKNNFTWNTMFIWNYLAYYYWPSLAKHYNLSLVGCHLALLEPVHLKFTLHKTDSDKAIKKSNIIFNQRESESYISFENEHILDEQNLNLINDNMLMTNVKMSNLRAASTSPGGFTGWTARLGLTASMLGTSLLGCSLVLLLTCLGMICLQSKSSNSTKREPIIRVLPLTINLMNNVTTDSVDSDSDQNYLLSPEWTVACGHVYYKSKKNGEMCSVGLLAVTSVRSYLPITLYRSKIIQLWCADSGNVLHELKRYIQKRQTLGEKTYRHLFYTKKFIWDCESGQLLDILYLKNISNNDYLVKTGTQESLDSSTISHSKVHPGGITIMRIIDESRFCVGTSHGVVAYFHVNYTKDNLLQTFTLIRQWNSHIRAVSQLDFLKYCNTNLIDNLNDLSTDIHSSNHIAVIIISGSEDGCIKLALGVSHASGSLYVCFLELLYKTTNKSVKFKDENQTESLEIRLNELNLLNSGFGISPTIQQSTTLSTPSGAIHSKKVSLNNRLGSMHLQLFTRTDRCHEKMRRNCNSHEISANYRLVAYNMDGSVVIWDIQHKCIIRSFKANLSTFNMSNLLLSVDGRVVFGDQSYLRVVNPWTAKYERSVQLLPPSSINIRNPNNSTNSSHLSALLRLWIKELVPIGITSGDFESLKSFELYIISNQINEQKRLSLVNIKMPIRTSGLYVISIADNGRTLVVVPISTIKFD
ncbi:Sterol regulatory element-binding protein cleavage-activating protein [Schistosoma japonicum]|nr:Sterol regulatory element-binding protein cleavage-activating protein [Schistosoma japonicum]KAH8878355.1 Sterol regulatory element-binding protein cleavage-activating protein [Schistosoma japonicum]